MMPQSIERWLQRLSDGALNTLIRNLIPFPQVCGECSTEFTHPMDLIANDAMILPYDPAYFHKDTTEIQKRWQEYARNYGGYLVFCRVTHGTMHHCYQKWLSYHEGAAAYITKRGLERATHERQ